MRVEKINRDEWKKKFSETAHLLAFAVKKPAHFDRIDYALLCVDETGPLGYLTAREVDHETVYWQFGGTFQSARGSLKAFRGYSLFVEWTKAHYKRVTTRIENSNTAMLRLAMSVGFRIQGVVHVQDQLLVEHVLEFT